MGGIDQSLPLLAQYVFVTAVSNAFARVLAPADGSLVLVGSRDQIADLTKKLIGLRLGSLFFLPGLLALVELVHR